MNWFVNDRFGMFVHWGPYSLAARHEWVKTREKLTDAQYQPYVDHFSPDLYDPAAWARTAKAAGMRYAVLTTKHHDGFCLWDSELTDYKARRDLVEPFVAACRAEGLRVGFYHSLIDWHHRNSPWTEPIPSVTPALPANATSRCTGDTCTARSGNS